MALVNPSATNISSEHALEARAAVLRVCVFGADAALDWLADVRRSLPAKLHIERCSATDLLTARREAAARFPGDDLILLCAGTALPPWWFERLLRARDDAD